MITTARGSHRPARSVGASSSAVERELGGYCAEAARDQLRKCERAENQLAAKRVIAAASCARARVRACSLLGIAAERAEKLANSEVAVALTVSERIAQNYIAIGEALRDRLPLVRRAFEAGDLDHRRVDAIWRSTVGIDDSLLSRVEAEIVAAARRLPPGRLGVEIDRLLIAADPAQAALRRKHREAERNIRTGRSGNGIGFLEGRLTAEEIAALEAYVTELAGTVCSRDPRDRQQLRADAFVALIHGESTLACRCGDENCPAAGRDEHTRRRKPHILVHVNLQTLAGLADDPAVLAGFGVIGPQALRAGRYPHPIWRGDSRPTRPVSSRRATRTSSPGRGARPPKQQHPGTATMSELRRRPVVTVERRPSAATVRRPTVAIPEPARIPATTRIRRSIRTSKTSSCVNMRDNNTHARACHLRPVSRD